MAQLHSDSATDVATSSNFRQVRTSNIHLDLDVCFDKQTITGVARITFEVLQSGVKEGTVSEQISFCRLLVCLLLLRSRTRYILLGKGWDDVRYPHFYCLLSYCHIVYRITACRLFGVYYAQHFFFFLRIRVQRGLFSSVTMCDILRHSHASPGLFSSVTLCYVFSVSNVYPEGYWRSLLFLLSLITLMLFSSENWTKESAVFPMK